MPGPIRHTDTGAGWIKREHKAIWKAIRESNAAKKLQAATIGKGGLTVNNSGQVRVKYAAGASGITMGPYNDGTDDDGIYFTMLSPGTTEGKQFTVDHVIFPSLAYDHWQLYFYGDKFTADADSIHIGAEHPSEIYIGPTAIYIEDSFGLYLSHAQGVKINAGTTGLGANAVLDADGTVLRSVSSRRYKQDIADADIDPAKVLALKPRQFRMKADVERDGDEAPTYLGFIAEEAADAGLDAFVTTDEQGPNAFSYDRYVVALQAVVKDLAARVAALEAGE